MSSALKFVGIALLIVGAILLGLAFVTTFLPQLVGIGAGVGLLVVGIILMVVGSRSKGPAPSEPAAPTPATAPTAPEPTAPAAAPATAPKQPAPAAAPATAREEPSVPEQPAPAAKPAAPAMPAIDLSKPLSAAAIDAEAGSKIKRKIILIGDGAVGKTSLIRRFVYDEFDDKYLTTIGTKITKKELQLPLDTGGNIDLTMMIWDVLGQKGYQSVQSKAYEKASGALLVCDITRKDTLQSLQDYWIPNLQEVAGKVPLIFLANKVDLLYSMDYSMEELEQIFLGSEEIEGVIKTYNSPFYRSSAFTGENVEDSFMTIAKMILTAGVGVETSAIAQKGRRDVLTAILETMTEEFCESYGDYQKGKAIIQKILTDLSIDPKNCTKEMLIKAIERIAAEEEIYLGADVAKKNKDLRTFKVNKFT